MRPACRKHRMLVEHDIIQYSGILGKKFENNMSEKDFKSFSFYFSKDNIWNLLLDIFTKKV